MFAALWQRELQGQGPVVEPAGRPLAPPAAAAAAPAAAPLQGVRRRGRRAGFLQSGLAKTKIRARLAGAQLAKQRAAARTISGVVCPSKLQAAARYLGETACPSARYTIVEGQAIVNHRAGHSDRDWHIARDRALASLPAVGCLPARLRSRRGENHRASSRERVNHACLRK